MASVSNGRADSQRNKHVSTAPQGSQHGRQQYYPSVDANPASFHAPSQQHAHHQDAGDFERLERQALRRRKVEALESLAHTAALFLAEFMTHNNKNKASSRSSAGPGESGGSATAGGAQNHGMDYAAAAAAAGRAVSPCSIHLGDSSLRWSREIPANFSAETKGRPLSNPEIKVKWPERQQQCELQPHKHNQQRRPEPGKW